MILEFNDGTKPIDVKVLVSAESCLLCKDSDNLFYIVNTLKLKNKSIKEEKSLAPEPSDE